MELLKQALALAPKIMSVTADVLVRHIGRQEVVRTTFLSLVSGRPVFYLGSPGVDKTGTIQAIAGRISGAIFFDALMPTVTSVEQLLVESTSIEELPTTAGGRQIRTRDTLGRAAGAHLVFADEIWKAEPRVLQTLIDLSKGDGVRHEGTQVKTPLLAFLAASNELPDPEGNLGAVWSRMTLRVVVNPLDRGGKQQLVQARLQRDRAASSVQSAAQLTLDEIDCLRSTRPLVEIPSAIVESVLDIYQSLVDESAQDFDWAWADDRRFGRVFDVMQTNALLEGRPSVGKQDLAVLEWLLWDRPEQIAVVKAKLAPYTRTPLTDAREVLDGLLAPGGTVAIVMSGDRSKGVQALTQVEACEQELARLKGEADAAMQAEIEVLQQQVASIKAEVIAVVTGAKAPQGGE